jgi:hypothetical protein
MFDSKECEWFDMDVYLDGVKLAKVKGLKYKHAQEKEALHAAGNKPLGIQRGTESFAGTMTVLKSVVDALNDAAVAAGGSSLLDLALVGIAYYKPKGGRPPKTDTLIGLEFTEYEMGMEQNAKSMDVSLPFIFLDKASV